MLSAMNKEERCSYISKRAKELALSGKFSGWLQIEREIRSEGYSEARQVLDNPSIRSRLDKICADVQARKR